MRIIFNTTFIVNESIETEWISFIRKYYLAYLRQNRLTPVSYTHLSHSHFNFLITVTVKTYKYAQTTGLL